MVLALVRPLRYVVFGMMLLLGMSTGTGASTTTGSDRNNTIVAIETMLKAQTEKSVALKAKKLSKKRIQIEQAKSLKVKRYMEALNNLTNKQKIMLVEAYGTALNSKTGDGLLAAINWRESDFGRIQKYKIWIGPYQVDPYLVLKTPEYNLEGYKSVATIKKRLLTDHAYAKRIAKAELNYWYGYWKDGKKHTTKLEFKTLAGYNGGCKALGMSKAREYAEDVLFRAKVIDKWVSENATMLAKLNPNILYNLDKNERIINA